MKYRYLLLFSMLVCMSNGINFTYDNDLEGWIAQNGRWRWTDRQLLPNILPAGPNDGFAVLDEGDGADQLYWSEVSSPYGGQVTITFFARSDITNATQFQLRKSNDTFLNSHIVFDFGPLISAVVNQFSIITVDLFADTDPYFIGFYCYNSNKADDGNWFQGCAIDSLTITEFSGPTTTAEPTTTTPEPTTQAPTTKEPTTQEPTTSKPTTPEPTTTTPEPTTPKPTTPEPTTTTPEPTTPEPTTTTTEPTTPKPTTAEPTTTTPEPTTQQPTTESPPGSPGYNFQGGMDGWTLSHMNGAYWVRSLLDGGSGVPGIPVVGPWIIEIKAAEMYSGVTLAQSPYFEATSSEIQVQVTFWMEGVEKYPCQLKVRKRNSIEIFDQLPLMNLDSYGVLNNSNWITIVSNNYTVTMGEKFVLVFEGSLGSKNTNKLYVSEIIVSGVVEVPVLTNMTYDFEDGLPGFSSGNMDASRWSILDWNDGGNLLGYPKPISGSKILVIEKFDVHSGVATIETPPILVAGETAWRIKFKFWPKGTINYKSALRLRIKTNGGLYLADPFANLIMNGEVTHPFWISQQYFFTIVDLPADTIYFQLVIEGDIGSDNANLLALDDLEISLQ